MFIHAIPGIPAREIFLYRPYDKATVWEQRNVLSLGRRFGARVFLWECMALQPDLVNLLQSQWMRDDYSTITNAYPDHEDVQGPTGVDVATCIYRVRAHAREPLHHRGPRCSHPARAREGTEDHHTRGAGA